jgi:Secretion system C-terminal sorting domain
MRILSTFVFSVLTSLSLLSQCGPDSTLVSMFVTVDPWGEENYWELVPTGNGCGNGTLYFGANPLVGCAGTAPEVDGGYPDNSIFEVPPFCLPTGQVLDLIFVDSYGDGGPIFELYENGSFAHAYFGGGTGNTWTFEVGNSGLPAFDSPCGAAEIIPNGDGVALDNSACIAQTSEPRPAGGNCGLPGAWCEGNITATAWAYFVAEAGVTYEITSCNEGAGFDTQLALYKANDCLGWSSFELVAANDDMAGGCSVSNGYSSLLYASCLEAGSAYYIQVDGWEGAIGEAIITVRTVDVANELQAVFNNIRCPISKGDIPQSSILPYLTGSGSNFECTWTGPAGFTSTDHNIYEIGPGEYFLSVMDACGSSFQTSFTVTQPDLWTVSTSESGPACEATEDGSIDLAVNGATAPYEYSWIGPGGFTSTQQDLQNVFAGNYQVTIIDANGCENSAFVILEPENSFSFSLGNDTTLCLNDQYQVVGPAGALYVWQDQSVNQFFNIVASQWGVGQHAIVLTATTPEGCVYADDLIFTVDDCTSAVELIENFPIHLFPNPSDGTMNVSLDAPKSNIVVRLFDMEGRLVESMISRNTSSILWKPEVSSGIYQLVIESDSLRYTTRWVKN